MISLSFKFNVSWFSVFTELVSLEVFFASLVDVYAFVTGHLSSSITQLRSKSIIIRFAFSFLLELGPFLTLERAIIIKLLTSLDNLFSTHTPSIPITIWFKLRLGSFIYPLFVHFFRFIKNTCFSKL